MRSAAQNIKQFSFGRLETVVWVLYPIESMYGIFTHIELIFYGKCR